MIRNFRGIAPQIASSAYIDPQAVVIGDVVIGEHTSVWPCAVIRGDVHSIRIGARCSIQDGSVAPRADRRICRSRRGRRHRRPPRRSCTAARSIALPDRMGSIILNGAKIGEGSIIAAGALIPERMEFRPEASSWARREKFGGRSRPRNSKESNAACRATSNCSELPTRRRILAK